MWESFAFDAAFVFGTGRMSAVGKKSGSVFFWQNLTKIRKWRSGLRSFAKKQESLLYERLPSFIYAFFASSSAFRFFWAVESISLIRFSWFTSLAPGS